jgi:BirA family biotin operon repressor/biotin-[acetyl-CoA-carboxylase] ligase
LSLAADARAARHYDGEPVETLAARWQLPAVHAYDAVGSTLDVAHALAPSASSGTLVIANEQTAGRGRHGRKWTSAPGAGVWLTLIERPSDARALDVLALRCGLYAAEALDDLAGTNIRVKWPNDLYVGDGKLAGILIETRWRGTAPEWVAIGFGLNVVAPDVDTAAGLGAGVTRIAALDRLLPALRRAAGASRHLSENELARWRERDLSVGRRIAAPANGTVQGISSNGELLVSTDGQVTAHRSGSLTFAEPLSCS